MLPVTTEVDITNFQRDIKNLQAKAYTWLQLQY